MVDFVTAHDRLMRAQREHPAATWPEALIRQVEKRAMVLEIHRATRRNK
jgi:hypothetical protein